MKNQKIVDPIEHAMELSTILIGFLTRKKNTETGEERARLELELAGAYLDRESILSDNKETLQQILSTYPHKIVLLSAGEV